MKVSLHAAFLIAWVGVSTAWSAHIKIDWNDSPRSVFGASPRWYCRRPGKAGSAAVAWSPPIHAARFARSATQQLK